MQLIGIATIIISIKLNCVDHPLCVEISLYTKLYLCIKLRISYDEELLTTFEVYYSSMC